MNRKLLLAALAVTAMGGAAIAADTMMAPRGPMQADANKDGVVSRAEFFAAAETRFAKLDANGDRKLSGEEVKGHGGRMLRLGADRDGTISFEEVAAATSARFTRLDTDKDGKLTGAELKPIGGRMHRFRAGQDDGPGMTGGRGWRRGEMGAMMLKRTDTDNDGRISRAEMRAQADERFDRMDANKDGFIDASEMDAMRARMPGRGGPGNDMPPPPEDDGGE